MSSLGDEYKILQDKIDKIGAFRVTIKGWSVTAAVALVVALSSGKGLSLTASALALDLLLASFFWLERSQVRLGWLFNGRARLIEVQIDKRRRAARKRPVFATPNIARSLFGTKKRRELIPWTSNNKRLESLRLRFNGEARLALGSDLIFYLILGLAVWLPKWSGLKADSGAPSITIQNLIPSQPQQAPKLGQSVPVAIQPSKRGGTNP